MFRRPNWLLCGGFCVGCACRAGASGGGGGWWVSRWAGRLRDDLPYGAGEFTGAYIDVRIRNLLRGWRLLGAGARVGSELPYGAPVLGCAPGEGGGNGRAARDVCVTGIAPHAAEDTATPRCHVADPLMTTGSTTVLSRRVGRGERRAGGGRRPTASLPRKAPQQGGTPCRARVQGQIGRSACVPSGRSTRG